MTRPMFINALGIATPAPGDQRQQIAALRAGTPLFERHPKWVGTDGLRQIMGFVPELRDLTDFPTRVAQLLHRAFVDCVADLRTRHGEVADIPLIVLLPPVLRHPPFQEAFRQACTNLDFPGLSGVELYFGGSSGALALIAGLELSDARPCAFVAAADSLVTPFMLDFLAAQGLNRDRLNPWNPIPSEAAACLLISRQPGLAQMLTCELARETESLTDPGRGVLGRAICTAIDRALSPAGAEIGEIFTDASTERWRAEELGIVTSERPRLSAEGVSWCHIVQSTGDPGVAAGLISVAAACHSKARSLILSSDRSGERAAAVIAPPPEPAPGI